MNLNEHEDLSSLSMQEIFRVEAETQTGLLNSGLLELESGSPAPQLLESSCSFRFTRGCGSRR